MTAPLQPQVDSFPTDLKERPAWVLWKTGKVPFDPKVPFVPHHPASSTDPTTWGTYEQALAAYQSGGFAGYGVVLDGDGVVGVDLDNCVDDGVPSPAALKLAEELGAGYVELSPSGRGLRMFGYGDPLPAGVNGVHDGLKAEFYSTGRYLTITGHTLKNEPLRALKNFAPMAQMFKVGVQLEGATTGKSDVPPDERYAAWVDQIHTGAVYHDPLRDLAASLVSSGLNPKMTEALLFALMDGVTAPKDQRWESRRKQIPKLIQSAYEKFAARGMADATAKAGRYVPLGGTELRALPYTKWRVKGVMPDVGLAAVFGPPGSGKTFLCMALAAAMAHGGHWFGHKVSAADVLYVALEGEGGIKQRAAAWEQHNKVPLPARLGFVLNDFKIVTAQDIVDLASVVQRGGVVFIDTLNRAAPAADENNSSDMGKIIEGAKALQQKTGGLVILVHHTGKDVSKGPRGHSSLLAALDTAIEVARSGEDREWRIAKSKDGDDGDVHSFRLETILLGRDDDGDAMSSCVVVPVAGGAIGKPLTTPQQQAVYALKDAAFDRASEIVNLDDWRSAFGARCGPKVTPEARRQAFRRAKENLLELGVVAEHGGTYGLADFTCQA